MADLIDDPGALAKLTDDEFAKLCWRESGLALGEWLEAAQALNRPIRSLQIHEVAAMAQAAIARYTVLVSARLAGGGTLLEEQARLFAS
jgi:hypothetical protein